WLARNFCAAYRTCPHSSTHRLATHLWILPIPCRQFSTCFTLLSFSASMTSECCSSASGSINISDGGSGRMNLAVRRASLTDDRDEIVDLMNRNLVPEQEKRFEWRHLNHPAGPAWCWFVYDRNSKVTVATASVFPRQMFVDGKSVRSGQVGGFAV